MCIRDRLYTALMALLRLQGVRTVYALVTLPNEKSEGLHRSMGFRLMGVQRSTGYKDGAWRDVAWFELPIAPYDQDPVSYTHLDVYKRQAGAMPAS